MQINFDASLNCLIGVIGVYFSKLHVCELKYLVSQLHMVFITLYMYILIHSLATWNASGNIMSKTISS